MRKKVSKRNPDVTADITVICFNNINHMDNGGLKINTREQRNTGFAFFVAYR